MKRKQIKNTLISVATGAIFLWSITGSYTLEFISTSAPRLPELIDLDIDFMDPKTGVFTAEANGKRDVWEVVGALKGNKVEFELTPILSDQRIVVVGKIDEDGLLSGQAVSGDGEEYEWEATDRFAKKMLT